MALNSKNRRGGSKSGSSDKLSSNVRPIGAKDSGSERGDKERAIALAVSTIEKQFGKGAILKMGEDGIDREVGVSLNKDNGTSPNRGLYQPEPGPNSTASLTWDQFDSEVYALFGQVEWDISDSLELSFALRY